MKIINLQVENIKRLIAVEITPDGNLVQITGRNGAGKSSLLDAIWWALGGERVIQDEPIRKGETEARIRLDLGQYIVTRSFTRSPGGETKSVIMVQNTDGARFPSPQKTLDSFLGALTFDPLEFARMKPAEQFNELKRFVPDVDFSRLKLDHDADYAARTEANRRAKEARTVAQSISVPPATPSVDVDTAALTQQLHQAANRNAAIAEENERRRQVGEQVGRLREQAADHERRAAILRQEADTYDAELRTLPPFEEPDDIQAITAQVDRAIEVNRAVAARRELDRQRATAERYEQEGLRLTARMEERESEKRKAIAAANIPVAGLSFGDGIVLKDGVPFEQASDAERLRVSVAIAMAQNPDMRVLRVRDGSLLDSTSLALIAEMAQEKDFQVWVEMVREDGQVGFVIEDGAVASTPMSRAQE